ncbi:MAG: HsdR family type I site-specific deoxyribonuclease [Spirochaetia bacterium]|nr:HsdR family type I site-specific deoxyribonuclease [Spirochaetia bacterium]
MKTIHETDIELFCLEGLRKLKYPYASGPDIAPDGDAKERENYQEVLLVGRLEAAVKRINRDIPDEALEDAVKQVRRVGSPDLLADNETFHHILTEGVKVTYRKDGHDRGDYVKLIDFFDPENNDFLVVNQYTVFGLNDENKRPDVVVFVNGLPIVVIELKNPADENATVMSAYRQIQTYKQAIPALFTYNGFIIISDGLEARAGTVSSEFNRFMAWKSSDGVIEASPLVGQLETLIKGMLNRKTLLDLIRHFVVFEKRKKEDIKTGIITVTTEKKLAAYHQYYAVNRAVDSAMRAAGYMRPSSPALLPEGEGGKAREANFLGERGKTINEEGGDISTFMVEENNYRGGYFFSGLVNRARELRKKQTDAEVFLWELIRNNQILGFKFRRQHQIGDYIVDFYCDAAKLVLELDGNVHEMEKQQKHDSKRDKYLTSLGNKVLRFKNEDVLNQTEDVLNKITGPLSTLERTGEDNTPLSTWEKTGEDNIPLSPWERTGEDNIPLSPWERTGEGSVNETPESYGLPGVKQQPVGDRKGGVVWHTQGSGKSLSMVFFAGKIILAMDNPTIVVITDRNDLDDQLFDTFAASRQLLRQEPEQAENRIELKKMLDTDSGHVIFTTIHKFMPEEGNVHETLNTRENIVVIVDEAHRTQYGFKPKNIDEKDAEGNVTGKKTVYGFAKYLRDALPNATYIGFTGTPIEKDDINTPAVFGNYVDIYDIAQAVEDGATVRIYYESRLAKISMSDEGRKLINELDEDLSEEDLSDTQKAKAKWTQIEALVGSADRIKRVAADVVAHFEQRQEAIDGKAMIVTMSRRIAALLYKEITSLRPQWHDENLKKGAVKVVMTSASSDGPEIAKHHTTKEQRRMLSDRMKNPADELKLVIVRDMWLTGFDVPCLHTLYIDKPMKDHTLMQAIARVNRVYKDKTGGLVVDYLGIAADLKKALSFYSDAGGRGDPAVTQEKAVALMLEKLEIVSQMFHGFDYGGYFSADTGRKLSLILEAEEHILGVENGRKRFIDETTALSKAFSIAVPHQKAMEAKDEIGFFQTVKSRLVKFAATGGSTGNEEIETAIRQVIDRALVSDKVIDIFDAAGIKKPDISILSEEFLLEVKNMKHKNIAMEVLKKLLNDEIKARSVMNLVRGRSLMQMLEDSIKRYHNKILTAAEFIEELIKVSGAIKKMDEEPQNMKLSAEEYAFYTAVAENESARELMGRDKLRELAIVLYDRVRQNTSIDWTIKESVRAKIKVMVKRLLREYGYPPDMQALATETVLKQAELISAEMARQC